MTQLRQILAANIKKYRSLRGFSQMKLAERVDTAPNYIAMIETGRKFPSDRILEKMAQALNINAIDLFEVKTDAAVSLQAELIKKIHNDVLNDITLLIENRIIDIENTVSPDKLKKITECINDT
jgi:transcriptional regulator with XRE-family HTH domain